MKKLHVLFAVMLLCLAACSSKEVPIYKDLSFGMSHDEVKALGYCSDEMTIEDDYSVYDCSFTEFAGLKFESAKVYFKNDKLAKVLFYNSTTSGDIQRSFSKTIRDYLVPRYGEPREVNRCLGWKDDKVTYIQYIHSDLDTIQQNGLIYINELAIFCNELNPPK